MERLTKERFELIKNTDCDSCVGCKLPDCFGSDELIDEIEAQQQEIDRLKNELKYQNEAQNVEQAHWERQYESQQKALLGKIGRMGSALKESKRILNNALLEGCLSHVAQTSVFLQEIERLLGGIGDGSSKDK